MSLQMEQEIQRLIHRVNELEARLREIERRTPLLPRTEPAPIELNIVKRGRPAKSE